MEQGASRGRVFVEIKQVDGVIMLVEDRLRIVEAFDHGLEQRAVLLLALAQSVLGALHVDVMFIAARSAPSSASGYLDVSDTSTPARRQTF